MIVSSMLFIVVYATQFNTFRNGKFFNVPSSMKILLSTYSLPKLFKILEITAQDVSLAIFS